MWYNPLITAILRSPLHGLVSKHMLLLTYTGHKSGTEHTLPVNYLRNGDCLTVISFRHRTWWRNFRDSASVTLRLCGKTVPATAQAIADEDGVLPNQLITLISTYPRYATYLGIALGADGTPDAGAVREAAKTHVLVHLIPWSSLEHVCRTTHGGQQLCSPTHHITMCLCTHHRTTPAATVGMRGSSGP